MITLNFDKWIINNIRKVFEVNNKFLHFYNYKKRGTIANNHTKNIKENLLVITNY